MKRAAPFYSACRRRYSSVKWYLLFVLVFIPIDCRNKFFKHFKKAIKKALKALLDELLRWSVIYFSNTKKVVLKGGFFCWYFVFLILNLWLQNCDYLNLISIPSMVLSNFLSAECVVLVLVFSLFLFLFLFFFIDYIWWMMGLKMQLRFILESPPYMYWNIYFIYQYRKLLQLLNYLFFSFFISSLN